MSCQVYDEPLILRAGDQRLELRDGRRYPGLALPPDDAAERLARAWDLAPLEVMRTLAWWPVASRLRHRAEPLLDRLVALARWGDIVVIAEERPRPGGLAPRPRRPKSTQPPRRPSPASDAEVDPVIVLPSAVMLVGKDYLEPLARTPVRLTTTSTFDGEGRFSCSSGAVRFFREPRGGQRVDATALGLAGAELSRGIVLHAEAIRPSAAPGDVELRLHLSGGSKRTGPDAVATLTAVELDLAIFSDPRGRGGEQALEGATKVAPGRIMPLADPRWHNDLEFALDQHDVLTDDAGHPRARLVVHRARPAAFDGTLVLRRQGGAVDVMAEAERNSDVEVRLPLSLDNAAIGAAGHELFLDGVSIGSARLELTVAGTAGVGDAVGIEVLSAQWSRSEQPMFGYEDMDGDTFKLHHLSVASGGTTHARLRLRGAFQGNLFVVSDAPGVALPRAPEPLQAEMDVPIDGLPGHRMAHAMVAVHATSPDGPVIAAIGVHVYEELRLKVGIVRVRDPLSAKTGEPPDGNLQPLPDLARLERSVNDLLRPAVASVRLVRAPIDPLALRYDLDGNGVLTINFRRPTLSGLRVLSEDDALRLPFAATSVDGAVGIVVSMEFRIDLGKPAARGSTELTIHSDYTLTQVAFLKSQSSSLLVGGSQRERIRVLATTSNRLAKLAAPLKHDYGLDAFVVYDLGGISGRPGIVDQGDPELLPIKIAHELGHSALDLRDVLVPGNLMNNQRPFDNPLRYKRIPARYVPDDAEPSLQRQWDAARLANGRSA